MKKLTLLYYPRITDPERSGLDWEGDDETITNWDDLVRHETYYSNTTPNESIVDFVEQIQASQVIYISKWSITE